MLARVGAGEGPVGAGELFEGALLGGGEVGGVELCCGRSFRHSDKKN
jgi:hypothetical protein